jgi:hypothetical protein
VPDGNGLDEPLLGAGVVVLAWPPATSPSFRDMSAGKKGCRVVPPGPYKPARSRPISRKIAQTIAPHDLASLFHSCDGMEYSERDLTRGAT